MPLSELTERDAVLAAMREYDALGQYAFLAKYGYSPARRYQLVHDGKSYDSKAIAGVALKHQFPERGPLAASEFSGGEATVLPLLRNLGFEIRAMDQSAPAVTIGANDVQLIRQSRARANYSDLSVDERNAFQRVHTNLEQLGSIVREQLASTGSYTLKLTSGFNPNSGVRGYLPKDLWFAVSNERNADALVAMPQLFMIVSERGIEYGFACNLSLARLAGGTFGGRPEAARMRSRIP